ncbi:MAG: DNA polymerase I, partial [Sphingomonadaceae bacterium]|nr:DNA polymerase I [Sphingomonadaceae bacterium]
MAASDPKHLYLVDGSSYIFRAYHRLPPLTNTRGEPVGAVYGYTTMLWKLVDQLNAEEGPTHMAVILDASAKSFRNEIYEDYKANRPPPPEDLVPQFPMIRDATRAFSLPCIEELGFEADDLIASYAKAALAEGWKVTIVSSDKDLMQLIEPGLDMLDTMKDARMSRETVEEKFGVGPEKLGEVLALMGDTSDNIPGVAGIGPKRASDLINEYGTVEAVLAAAPEMKKSKMRENLIEQAELARMSRVLVTLKEDVPLPEPLDYFALDGIPEGPLREFLSHHGFKSLLTRLGGDGPANAESAQHSEVEAEPAEDEAPIDRSTYETVTDAARLDAWIAEARRIGHIAVDTETDSLESVTARLVGVCLATAPGKACYVPLGHGGEGLLDEKPEQIDFDVAIAKLKELFEDPAVLKIGHNLKYDIGVLRQYDIALAPIDDTIVMSFDLKAGMHGHGMDEIAQLFLGHECIKFKDVVGTGKKQISFGEVPLDRATEYAAEDADVTLRLWKRLKPRLHADKVTRVYELVDRPLVPVIARMECAGIKVDREELS